MSYIVGVDIGGTDVNNKPQVVHFPSRGMVNSDVTELCPHGHAEGDEWVLRARLTAVDCRGALLCEMGEILGGFYPNLRGLRELSEEQFNGLTHRV